MHHTASEILTSARVLVVEDEPKTRDSIAEALQLDGATVTVASRGREMMACFDRETFDLVVLDWMLPGRDGLELLHDVRARGVQVPVLMLTARDGLKDRVAGLESGADDYLPKPFALEELIARCHALLRRPILSTDAFLSCQDLRLDTRARRASRAGDPISLSPREVEVLEYLMRYQGQIVSREMLERAIWRQYPQGPDLDNVIYVQMMRLRRKVDGDRPNKLIHTKWGVGYQLGGDSEARTA